MSLSTRRDYMALFVQVVNTPTDVLSLYMLLACFHSQGALFSLEHPLLKMSVHAPAYFSLEHPLLKTSVHAPAYCGMCLLISLNVGSFATIFKKSPAKNSCSSCELSTVPQSGSSKLQGILLNYTRNFTEYFSYGFADS